MYHIFVLVSTSHVHFEQVSPWHRFQYIIHIPQVTTQMFKIYIVYNTLEFLISALRTCVVTAFRSCHAARMNQTLTQTKMPHAALYAFHILQSINVNGIRHFDTLGSALHFRPQLALVKHLHTTVEKQGSLCCTHKFFHHWSHKTHLL
jgi:hypothetical protein